MNIPAGLGEVLEVYCLVRRSKLPRIRATREVARTRRIDPNTVSAACTRSLGISTEELDYFLEPENKVEFKNHLVKRYPEFLREIDTIFAAAEGEVRSQTVSDLERFMRSLFRDEVKGVLRSFVLKDASDRLSRLLEWDGVTEPAKAELRDIMKRIAACSRE